MSMKQYLRLKVKAAKDRWSRDNANEKKRIDDRLPLNLRVGSRIQFAEAPFLLAGDASHTRHPGEETLLSAFSDVTFAGMKTYRLYLDSRLDPDESSMLMLLMDDKGNQVTERYVFHEQYELPLYHVAVPENEDESTAVDFWLAENAGVLGMPLFYTPDDSTYERMWEADSDTWLSPVTLNETINLDPYGEQATQVEHLGTMLFARMLEGLGGAEIQEYLLPTVERDDNGFRVRIWVGISLDAADIELPDAI